MKLKTCVSPEGRFIVGIHRPEFEVRNLRQGTYKESLGRLKDGTRVDNDINFPKAHVHEPSADPIYEIANPFPFRGATFINSAWADPRAGRPEAIGIPDPCPCSFTGSMEENQLSPAQARQALTALPRPMKLALAQASTDARDLTALAMDCCTILFTPGTGIPSGMGFKPSNPPHQDRPVPDIWDHDLFDILVNNPFLPDDYKNILVLKPGVQGTSEIIGEYQSREGHTHVFEYLRRNSYIPWGHFASNMANDAIRYRACDLCAQDMTGIRHLFYQRVYVRLAQEMDIALPGDAKCLTGAELETLRKQILGALETGQADNLFFNGVLWGWNFGFGAAQSGHRLHASHQMIHQQNALIPRHIVGDQGVDIPAFSCGDRITDFIDEFRQAHGIGFFDAYIRAIQTNQRTDGRTARSGGDGVSPKASLVVYEDENVMLFAPKGQVSEWELQLMTKTRCSNVVMADSAMRSALDKGILLAVQVLERLGAKMVTAVEFSGRIGGQDSDQHLVYDFIPRLPYAPPTFSEAQLRWISGCYPEDFAHACREAMTQNREDP